MKKYFNDLSDEKRQAWTRALIRPLAHLFALFLTRRAWNSLGIQTISRKRAYAVIMVVSYLTGIISEAFWNAKTRADEQAADLKTIRSKD